MDNRITYQELIDTFADASGMTKTQSDAFIKAFRDAIIAGLNKDRKVSVSGFGIFELLWVEERQGRNPQTGETITVEAHNRILFKPTGDLRKRINAAYEDLSFEILDDEIISTPPKPVVVQDSKSVSNLEGISTSSKPKSEPEPEKKPSSKNEEAQKPLKEVSKTVESPKAEKKSLPATNWLPVVVIGVLSVMTLAIIISQSFQNEEDVVEPKSETQTTESIVEKPPLVEKQKTVTKKAAVSDEPVFLAIHQSKNNEWFYSIAKKYYGNARFWPFIYQANANMMGDPDSLTPNTTLRIPEVDLNLEKPDDRIKMAMAYLAVYRGYQNSNKTKARKYLAEADDLHPDGLLKNHRLQIELSDAAWLALFTKKQ